MKKDILNIGTKRDIKLSSLPIIILGLIIIELSKEQFISFSDLKIALDRKDLSSSSTPSPEKKNKLFNSFFNIY